MLQWYSIGVLAVAGAALVLQNILMVKVTEKSSTIIITLLLNSASGFILLLMLLYFKSGTFGITEALQKVSPSTLAMGLLGSFFVFAGILGYKNLGASSTIATLVCSQLLCGILWDLHNHPNARLDLKTILGAVFLILGVVLILQQKNSPV
ncbi:MAG: DMT family transporter [Pseudomonadota bacterium]|nr:DMT family transporter [Pseudomonadota bacterium]